MVTELRLYPRLHWT